jgi:uncharacterized membrane protein
MTPKSLRAWQLFNLLLRKFYIAGWIIHPKTMNSKKVAIIAILVALATATNYAMMPLYNIKLMDIIVFLGGFSFGPLVGALVGVTSWAVYGTLNPLGFSVHILLATMLSESIYGIAGGLTRKSFTGNSGFKQEQTNAYFFFGVLGFLSTLTYDVITNIVFGYVYGPSILVAVIIGFVPFGLLHVISNAFFFGLGCVPAINALLKVVGVENFGISEK